MLWLLVCWYMCVCLCGEWCVHVMVTSKCVNALCLCGEWLVDVMVTNTSKCLNPYVLM